MFDYPRLPDWTSRWAHFVKDSLDIQSDISLDWEHVSCTSYAAQGIEAITGHNPFEEEGWAGSFTTALGAAKAILSKGFKTLDDVIASLFPEIPLAYAWPGDVLLVRTLPEALDAESSLVMPHGIGICDPPLYLSPAIGGLGRQNMFKDGLRAFAIGHKVP